jgi:hypothetical protein
MQGSQTHIGKRNANYNYTKMPLLPQISKTSADSTEVVRLQGNGLFHLLP